MEEVENNSVSVRHCLQGGWSRAELANSCWKAWWDSGELEQALARIVFVVYGVCSPRFHSCPSREIRGQRWSLTTCSLEVSAAAFLLWWLWLNSAPKLSAIGQDFCLSAPQIFAAVQAPGSRFASLHWLFQSTKMSYEIQITLPVREVLFCCMKLWFRKSKLPEGIQCTLTSGVKLVHPRVTY